MKKESRNHKKKLKKRLAGIMMIYKEVLSENEKEKLLRYLESQIGYVVDYYVKLLKKKGEKLLGSRPLTEEILTHIPASHDNNKKEIMTTPENTFQVG